jgi:hypothetical protein
MSLIAIPISRKEANEFISSFHRHNSRVTGHIICVAVSDGDQLVGVAIAGRPVARALCDGTTIEVTRCCVLESAPKGSCSFLYARCWTAAKALGYRKMITYTLQSESGASLRGAGWKVVAELKPRTDSKGWTNRVGRSWQAVTGQAKFRWEVA